ncbi:serine-rich adhesin for platelets-like [Battus philenor]|uniref:serine-rich adhesin for platelets-like n=1 Tax=Battus philenor TaxID=42288 RepID=UPI0035CEB154
MDSGRLESVPPGTAHLDTVRALHQTVVSLRTALEISKNELKELKEKYEQHSNCIEYADVIEKLTVENHVLRRKIIDSGLEKESQNIKLQVSYSPKTVQDTGNDEEYTSATELNNKGLEILEELANVDKFSSNEKLEEIQEENIRANIISDTESPKSDNSEADPNSEIGVSENIGNHLPSYKTKLELLSKFDVKIKVKTIKENCNISSSTTESDSISDQKTNNNKFRKESTDSQAGFHFEEKKEHFENLTDIDGKKVNFKTVSTENIKMAVPNEAEVKSKTDKFDVQVRITSEENLIVEQTTERLRRKDTLNLDVDDLSLRSMSEGDNSVFSEGGTTPMESGGAADDKDQDNASGNESEEVDDIELIFTTDESKDMSNLQEDLVSIRETDQWVPNSASTVHSTPVLIKFHTLDPDFQPGETSDNAENENQENSNLQGVIGDSNLKQKRVSLPNDKDIKHVAFNGKGSLDLPGRGILKSCPNKSDNMLYRRSPNASTRRLDSVDSLTCEYNRGLSFDNTKSSSFELGSSMDILHREESIDSFQKPGRLGHRFSVFAETDISKCGISEDDLASNFNIRRNTCPNPFQYRPLPYRGTIRSGKSVASSRRPILREGCGPRRESAAQTEVSALPPRWTSDGYLAYKSSSRVVSCPTTVPQRTVTSRRLTVPDPRPPPARRTDEARRVLLSDIGFTSMVPELSRSAEPLWNLRRTAPDSPQPRRLSRGSYRSPCLSIDRSNDWTPNTNSNTAIKGEYRAWRGSLPDVRPEPRDDTDDLLEEAETFLRRSIDNLTSLSDEPDRIVTGQPYVPGEVRQLRLGHAVKLITPQGRLAVGRVRYVGIAGGSAANSGVVVGAEFSLAQYPGLPRNDGTYRGRRYFLTPPQYTALFVPFSKVVMAWAN